MKNKFAAFACALLIGAVIGCSAINPLSSKDKSTPPPKDKTVTDKGVDTVVGDETIGVPECDEVMDMLSAEMNNPDDNFIVKAGKAVVLNRIKEGIKKSVEDNKNDKTELTKTCKDFKRQLDKYKAEEEQKSGK